MRAGRFWASGLVLMMIASLFVAAGNGSADQGGGDGYGYQWTDSDLPDPRVGFDWIEISGTGTELPLVGDDNWVGPYAVGFNFTFYGNKYSEFFATTNGLVTFGQGTWEYNNFPIPTSFPPNNYIAPYWDDLCVDYAGYNYGAVYYELIGSSPNQQLVVEWWEISELGTSQLLTFEAILNETGEIWFQYLELSGMTGEWATVGLENIEGHDGCQYSYNSAVLHDSLAIRFSMSAIGFGPDQSHLGLEGSSEAYDVMVSNNQAIADSFDITYTSVEGWAVNLYDAAMSPLTDNNGNGLPDTGDLLPGERIQIIVTVDIPSPPTADWEVTTLTATSFNDSLVSDDAVLTTGIGPAAFWPPHSDYGLDTNGDGFYDFLLVEAMVNVSVEGLYVVGGILFTSSMEYIAEYGNYTYLSLGLSAVSLWFAGGDIYMSGADGPYVVELMLFDNVTWSLIDEDDHTTDAYSHLDFQPIPAMFEPPYNDSGYDTDGDGFYNYLVVNVTLNATVSGMYRIYTWLWDAYGNWIMSFEFWVYLDLGLNLVPVLYDGRTIFDLDADGPYWAAFDLYDDGGNWLDSDEYQTEAYTYDQFQPPAAWFSPPHSDQGVDEDGDGLYDCLSVQISVEVLQGGMYWIDAVLYGPDWYYIDYNYTGVVLDPGAQTVEFTFPGWMLYANGLSGNFHVELYLYDDNFTTLDDDWHDTDFYWMSDFEQNPPMISSTWTASAPNIDGVYSSEEWADAVVVNITTADPMNLLDVLMLVKNNGTHLFVCYDAIGDHTKDNYDYSSFSFDTDNDAITTDEHEDQFVVGPAISNGEAHYTYEASSSNWVVDCSPFSTTRPGHAGLAGAYGFGSSDNDALSHRIYEYAIPLGLLGAELGDVLGFATVSWTAAGVGDGSDNWTYTTWPIWFYFFPELAFFGDLELAFPPPMTTASLAGTMGLEDWYVSSVAVTLSATGGNKGINRTVCRVDGGDWENYTEPIVVLGDGSHLVEFYSVDNMSNEEDLRNISFKIDTTDPVSSVSVSGTPGSDGWYVSDVDVSLEVDDGSGSGISLTKFRVDGGAWQDYSGPVALTSGGTHTIAYYSVDVAGNAESPKSVTVMIDKAAPSTSHELFGTLGPDDWYSTEVTIVLSATDAAPGSGVDAIRYSLDGNTWTAYDSPIVVIESGTHTIEYRAVDVAGNQETIRSVTFKLDVTAPETTHELSGTLGSHGWYTSAVAVTLAVTDNVDGSGPDVTMFRIGSGLWQTYSIPIPLAEDGEVTISFYSVDLVGNEETATEITLNIDREAPLTVASVSGTTVTLSASDGTSGLAKTMYRIDGGAWQDYTAAFEITGRGNHTVEFYSIDDAGNSEAVKTTWVEIGDGGVLGGGAAFVLGIAAIVVAVAVALYFLLWRKKKSMREDPAEPPAR